MNKGFILAAPCLAALSACGGSSTGSGGFSEFRPITTNQINNIVENSNGSGVALATRLGNSYIIYSSEIDELDLDSTANFNEDRLTITEIGPNKTIIEGNYVAGGNQKYIFAYSEQISDDEAVVAGLERNLNISGGEGVQAFGDLVSGSMPAGDQVYTGYNLVTSLDQTEIDAGTFTMRVNFETGRGSMSGSGDVSFVDTNTIEINSTNGTFSSEDVRFGYIDGDSATGFLTGNFHGNQAKGVTGFYGNSGDLAAVGVIAGSR